MDNLVLLEYFVQQTAYDYLPKAQIKARIQKPKKATMGYQPDY